MDHIRFFFLGGYKAENDRKPLRVFESDKARLLLAYLAVEDDRSHRRERLAGLFWPEKPESQAHHSLSQAIYTLHKRILAQTGAALLESGAQEVCFRPGAAWVDVKAFDSLVQECGSHAHPPDWGCPACLERLEEAAGLYQGDFLSGYSLPDCQELEDWLRLQREHYRLKMVQAAGWLSQGWEALNDLERALAHARRQAALDPFDESAHRRIMQLLRRMGRRPEALAQYAVCQQILRDELGVEAEAETVALVELIKSEGSLERVSPSQDDSSAKRLPSSLPALLAPLIGRDVDLERLCQVLLEASCRLVTVLGAGGAGKTSLALEAGRRVAQHFKDGVCLVELDTQPAGLSLLPMIARAVGLDVRSSTSGQLGSSKADLFEQVCAYLQERQILLILDGFEGLLHETGQVSRLLQALPALKIMATSRLRLGLASEQIFLLQGLSFPEEHAVENLAGYAAVAFFREAARRHDPDFVLHEADLEAVAAISRINQGLPLGILLAAAWVNVLSPAQIITAIQHSLDFLAVDWHDLPDRQHSLRATFDHSWRLLKESERSIFLRLAVLRGSFTSERALQVAGAALENLKSLIEQSLLQHAALDRFRIHDLLRQYAQEKLAASPDENMEVHLRYSRIFLEALAAREKRLKSAEQPDVLSEIDQEYTDLTAAWGWAVGNGFVELLENAIEAFRYYHLLRGLSTDGKAVCLRTMQHLEAEGLDSGNLRLWVRLGIWLADSLIAQVEYEQAWMVIKQVEGHMQKWERLPAEMRREQAWLDLLSGDLTLYSGGNRCLAIEFYQKGLEQVSALENPWDISFALWKNAYVHDQAGNRYESGRYAEQALTIQRGLGDPQLLSEIWADLGYYYMLTGDYEAGLQVAKELVANQMRINTPFSQAFAMGHLGLALFYAGQYEQARLMFEQAIPAYTQPSGIGWRLFDRYILAAIDLQMGDYAAVLDEVAFSGETIADYYQDYLGLFKGQVYLLSADWIKGEYELSRYLDLCRSLPRLDMLGQPLALLAYIAYRRGDRVSGLDYLEQALVNGLEKGFF